MEPDIVTLAEYKVFIDNASGGTDAARSAWITQVSQAVASYCGRGLIAMNRSDEIQCDSESGLKLSAWPVNVITAITLDPYGDVPDTTTITPADVYERVGTGCLYLKDKTRWPWELVRVAYNGGYQSGAIPADLKLAVFRAVSMIERLTDPDADVTRKRVRDVEIYYGTVNLQESMWTGIRDLLSPYVDHPAV